MFAIVMPTRSRRRHHSEKSRQFPVKPLNVLGQIASLLRQSESWAGSRAASGRQAQEKESAACSAESSIHQPSSFWATPASLTNSCSDGLGQDRDGSETFLVAEVCVGMRYIAWSNGERFGVGGLATSIQELKGDE